MEREYAAKAAILVQLHLVDAANRQPHHITINKFTKQLIQVAAAMRTSLK